MTMQEAKAKLYDTTVLLGMFRRRAAIKELAGSADPAGVVALAEALGKGGHPDAGRIADALRHLSAERDADKVKALWVGWAATPTPALASILEGLGWPPAQPVDSRLARAVLGLYRVEAAPESHRAVAALARALPTNDEALNDAVYGAWIRSQSAELETLIAEQGRQPGSPALEALHALVTGQLNRYVALKDEDGMLLVQAYQLAPEPFRARLAQTVAASPDRRVKEAYRRALMGGGVDAAQGIDNLRRVGDEDGLFEAARSLRLAEVLGLCEHWAGNPGRPAGARQRAAVDRAVTAWRGLGEFRVEPGPQLPEGLVDLFEWWRGQQPDDARLRADLNAADPFAKARGLFLGFERGLVDAARIASATRSEHWPERLVARLVDPGVQGQAKEDHVLWVSACAGDASLLDAPIGGTPEDYARNTDLLGQARGPAAARNKALLEILCTFQGVFVASGITLDESAEAPDKTGVEIEDAPQVDF